MTGLSMTESFGRYDNSVPTAQVTDRHVGTDAVHHPVFLDSQVGAAAKVFGSRMATRNDGNLS